MSTERELRREMLRFSHLCYERNLLVGMDGNLSCRLPDGNILCTKAGCHKGLLVEEDLVVVDLKGKKLRLRIPVGGAHHRCAALRHRQDP